MTAVPCVVDQSDGCRHIAAGWRHESDASVRCTLSVRRSCRPGNQSYACTWTPPPRTRLPLSSTTQYKHRQINSKPITYWKSAQRRRKHCMLAVVRRSQKILPPQTPFSGARDGQNLITWKWSHLPTNPVWWGSMHKISSYRGDRPTYTQTHTPTTNRQDRLQDTVPQLACCVIITSMSQKTSPNLKKL